MIHPLVKAISFTGGTETGKTISSLAAPFLKKISLELGGKNAAIVCEDANLDDSNIATIVRSCFSNQGEICLCSSRILVHSAIYEKFMKLFREKILEVTRLGDPLDPSTSMGPLVSKDHLQKVKSYLSVALSEGGRFFISSSDFQIPSKGYFLAPHVIENLSPFNSRCMLEEIFGPVVCVVPFSSDEEALQISNCVSYGLSASIYTSSIKRAQHISSSLHAGTVWINCWMTRDLHMPFGGVKASGLGREGGQWSLDFFSEIKTICSAF